MQAAADVVGRIYGRVFVVFAILAFAGLEPAAAQGKQQRVGMKVHDLALPDTAGNTRRLSDHKGKVVLIDFWASWCGPCRKANPALIKVYEQYRTRNFEIYGISLDQSYSSWKRAIVTDGIPWIQVNDKGNAGEEGTNTWEIRYIPTSILLNEEGRIVRLNPTPKQLRSYLKKHSK